VKYDAVIVGSGFGGAMAAHRLVAEGARVLMIERGDWVERGPNAWLPEATLELTPSYAKDIPYRCDHGAHGTTIGAYTCVGGPSVYYGCVSFRFREQDFAGDRDVVANSRAAWPFTYDELEPYYCEAEDLLGIAGDDAGDPTAPRRSKPFPFAPGELAPVSQRVVETAVDMGLSPFRLPLAINHAQLADRPGCVACRTCDTYACAIGAKNDVATMMIEPLVRRGMELWTRTVAVRLEEQHGRIVRLHVHRRDTGEDVVVEADQFILAAGALGSPHLVLASKLDALSPARGSVGGYLMRHSNAMLFGVFPLKPDPERRFHKQIALHDWYFGDEADDTYGLTKLGGVQQLMTPPKELVRAHVPLGMKTVSGALAEQTTGLLCIAEDQPREANRVGVDWDVRDRYGLPQLVIEHAYTSRDELAVKALARRARTLLTNMGAVVVYTHSVKTFSHAVGTLRMGRDADASALDEVCRFRGVANLWITDGSALPMSAGVNPSLTIAANALRAADAIVGS
jgi:choline dehydrogenase-like flavoprotein